MSERLNNVIKRIDGLPPAEQALLAEYLESHLDDVLDEARWQRSFARSSSLLRKMSEEVDVAIAGGDVDELKPGEL